MSKFLSLGLSLEEVVAKATSEPAKVIGRVPGLGTFQIEAPADVAIFDVVEGPVEFVDTMKHTRTGTRKLVPVLTVRAAECGDVEAGASPRHHLPAMTLAEAIETPHIHRVAGLTNGRPAVVTTRPCRAPHHTISDVGLIGGGQWPMPGEASLAHHGLLFVDELPECKRHLLEVLRQPLENGPTQIPSTARPRPLLLGGMSGAVECPDGGL